MKEELDTLSGLVFNRTMEYTKTIADDKTTEVTSEQGFIKGRLYQIRFVLVDEKHEILKSLNVNLQVRFSMSPNTP